MNMVAIIVVLTALLCCAARADQVLEGNFPTITICTNTYTNAHLRAYSAEYGSLRHDGVVEKVKLADLPEPARSEFYRKPPVKEEEQKSPEESLLAAFPQLLWSSTKLEFMFEKRAELGSALAAGANSDDQAVKLAKQMETMFADSDERKKFTEGWKITGKVHSETVNFSKPNFMLSGIIGGIELLFDRDKLTSLSFWTDGSDRDFANLYRILARACNSPGERTIEGKDDSKINWTVVGSTNRYDVIFSSKKWESKVSNSVEVERGMTVFIKHPGVSF